MNVQDLFGTAAQLLAGPDERYAAVCRTPGLTVVLQSEAGRRITRTPLHAGMPSASAVLERLKARGFQELPASQTRQFAERAGFVAEHLRGLLH